MKKVFRKIQKGTIQVFTCKKLLMTKKKLPVRFTGQHFTIDKVLTYIIHSGFISGYQNRYGDNLKPPTNVYHRMTA